LGKPFYYNTDQLPHTHTSCASEEEVSIDHDIIRNEPKINEYEDDEDLRNDNFMELFPLFLCFFHFSFVFAIFITYVID